MNNIYDVLEICLQQLEKGADLETVLARFPDLASELRPILKASIMAQARSKTVSAPSPDAMRRGRAKLSQRAAEMREAKSAPRKRMIPAFQRLAISFTLAALFLASGTGLVGASSNALPGENLYPVKRTWEGMQIFFTFNHERKVLLTSEFESERLNEVDELFTKGRHETIRFSGVFRQAKGVMYVSGVAVLIPADIQLPADGAPVIVTGRTNAQGFVEIESMEALPAGVVVPVGKPVKGEGESDSSSKPKSGSTNESGSGSGIGSGNEARNSGSTESPKSDSQSFELKGAVHSVSNNELVVDGQTVHLDNTKVDGVLKPGVNVEVKGYYDTNGNFVSTEVKVKDSKSGSSGKKESSGSDSGSNDNSGSNSSGGSGVVGGDSGSGSGGGDGGNSGGGDGGSSGGGDGGSSGGGDGGSSGGGEGGSSSSGGSDH